MGQALSLAFVWGSLLSQPSGPPLASPLERAETALLTGERRVAERLLAQPAGDDIAPWRYARLRFELSVAQADRHGAERWAAELKGNTGWAPVVEAGLGRLRRLERRMVWIRAGVFSFAVALGLLLLGGGRELLRPRRAALWAGLGGAVGLALVLPIDPVFGHRLGMTAIAGAALMHAAEAACERQAAGPKWRLLLATAVLVGTLGVALAAFAA